GYGKMGKAIENMARFRSHNISLIINSKNLNHFNAQKLKNTDVIIEFSQPKFAFENIKKGLKFNKPVVSGTTGWLDKYDEIVQLCTHLNGTFIHSNNFSIGVNLFFELTKKLATLMAPYRDYIASIEETHHTEKKDAPSGTALTLAETILQNNLPINFDGINTYLLHKDEIYNKKNTILNELCYLHDNDDYEVEFNTTDDAISNIVNLIENDVLLDKNNRIFVKSKRIGLTPGTHIVKFKSDDDSIEIKHTARNRDGFAYGVILAAEHVYNNKGIFTMKDILNL
ncbi:MAG: hypothetical protein ORN58_03050, partial [Sediminibacterium sp.]|nr:hypothetical protein [Sediminibacterium sp.]